MIVPLKPCPFVHETDDPVEQIGIARANDAMRHAELILAVFDGSHAPTDEDEALIEQLTGGEIPAVAVINKCDLSDAESNRYTARFAHHVRFSAASGEGMDALTALVERLFTDGRLDSRRDAVLTNARQHASVLSALEAVRRAREALRAGYPIDLCCNDAESAMSALSELDGRAVSEDIVSEIFSHFCVGK